MTGVNKTRNRHWDLFAVCAPGFEECVAAELRECGFGRIQVEVGGVSFSGHPLLANRVLASPTRILQRVARFMAPSFPALEKGMKRIDFSPFNGLTPHATCKKSRLYHSGAIEARVREWVPAGPNTLHIRLHRDRCTVSVDTSGERLHRRGWRLEIGPAPLRETLATNLLRTLDWQPGVSLIDPMCGSGTFVIEAANAAAGLAPGRLRTFSCQQWTNEPKRTVEFKAVDTMIHGSDKDQNTIDSAIRNAERAGVAPTFSVLDAIHCQPTTPRGILVCNPPYGRRVKSPNVYTLLGKLLEGPFKEWRAGIIVPNAAALGALGRSPTRVIPIVNGGLRLEFAILPGKGEVV
jgi:putative N6-adenine-specific DNA methylase